MKARAFLFFLIGITGAALGQAGQVGPNVTRTYDIRELTVRPALIYVSPTYTTLLEFEDLVSRVASAKGDILTAELRDNYVYLRALVPSGSTDLLVTVADGRVAMFRVQVDRNATGPRRYLIRFPTMPAQEASTALPAPTIQVQDESGRPVVPSPTPATPTPPAPTPTQVAEGMPPYLSVKVSPLWDQNILTLNLTLRNAGSNSVVADAAAVRLYSVDDKGQRTVVPISVSGGGRVAPGGIATVAVSTDSAPDVVELVWRISEIGVAKVWTYRILLRRDGK